MADPQHRDNALCPQGYRRRRPLQAALRPVGSADVPDPRRRSVRGDRRRPRRGGHRPRSTTSTPTGIVLKSGERIDADVIVTATGLQLQALGGVAIERRRRRGQAHRPVRLQGAPARGRAEHGVVHRLHQCVVDAARRHDRPCGREAVGLHGLSRLHARLPASRRRADAGEADVRPQGRLRAAGPARAAEVGHPPAVERAAQLRARHRSITASTGSRSRWCSAASRPNRRSRPRSAS